MLFVNEKGELTGGGFQRVEIIAKLFNLTVRRIQQLTQDGVLPTVETPEGRRYDLVPTIQRYVQYLSDKAYGRNCSEERLELERRGLDLRQRRIEAREAEIASRERQLNKKARLKRDELRGKYENESEAELRREKLRLEVEWKRRRLDVLDRTLGTAEAERGDYSKLTDAELYKLLDELENEEE